MKSFKPATNGYPYEMRGKQMECTLCGTPHMTTAQRDWCWENWSKQAHLEKPGACMNAYYSMRPVQGATWI